MPDCKTGDRGSTTTTITMLSPLLIVFFLNFIFMPWHFVNWSWLKYPFNMKVISFLLFRPSVFWHSCIKTCVHVVIQFSWFNKKLTSWFCRMIQIEHMAEEANCSHVLFLIFMTVAELHVFMSADPDKIWEIQWNPYF